MPYLTEAELARRSRRARRMLALCLSAALLAVAAFAIDAAAPLPGHWRAIAIVAGGFAVVCVAAVAGVSRRREIRSIRRRVEQGKPPDPVDFMDLGGDL